jgi:hypothetical protein
MVRRFLQTMIEVGPLHAVWLFYSGIGGVAFGALSIPSHGWAMILIPSFVLSGVILLYGAAVCSFEKKLLRARRISFVGMLLLTLSAWARGVALWGLDQQGNGSAILASFVWSWLCVGFAMMLVSVWVRGVRYY